MLISTEQLKTATGAKTISALEKLLRAQNVPFLYGKKGQIFTTLDALNTALGISHTEQKTDDIEFL